MTAKIFQKEFSTLLSSARFRWCTLIFLLLLAIGLANGINYYTVESGRRNEATEATYKQWLNQGKKNPHSAAHYGFYAYKPVSDLSILDKGLDDYLGNAIWLEAHNQNETKARSITDKLSLSRFGDLSIGMLLTLIIPLLIILLGYNTVSEEKENGTLRMLLSTRVSSRQLLWGKALALFVSSAIWLLVAMLCILVTLLWIGNQDITRTGLHLSIITLSLLLLQLAAAAGVTALSGWAKQSATSLVTGLAIWIIAAILIPRLNGTIAEMSYPLPTAFSFQQAIDHDKENGMDGHNPSDGRTRRFEQQVLRKYGVDSIGQLPVNFAGLSLQAGEEEGNRIFDKHFSALHGTLRKQDKVLYLLSVFSPLMAGRNFIHGLSETDLDRHTLFVDQAEKHRRSIQKLMNEDYAVGGAGKKTYLQGEKLWKRVNNFYLQNAGTSAILGRQLLNIGVLIAWLTLTAGLLMIAAKKLKPFA